MRYLASGLLIAAAILIAIAGSPPRDAEARLTIAPAGLIEGAARIVDGDTIIIADIKIRLHGIDAPESDQLCEDATGKSWKCGLESTRLLTRLTANRTVACRPLGLDNYYRVLASCSANSVDLNAELVRQGLAWAFVKYSSDYVKAETEARAARRGVFQAPTQAPWEFRQRKWQFAASDAPEGCAIKGNVNARGERIYHMPWSRYYGAVRMDESKGKRWFCSESEAIDAGWRPSGAR
ncbi:MAG: thermonuclease family protein [Hyphomicrobiaceae bacterium]|nr:MAG: thermonuclease family protein [Hyphomicrobiaceae bacterium]